VLVDVRLETGAVAGGRNTSRVGSGPHGAACAREGTHAPGRRARRQRRELPRVRVEKEYRFATEDGEWALAELFDGRSQLLVYHFMFGPDYTAGCTT
jgi:hypothetical protein